jgi:hypothetical protein
VADEDDGLAQLLPDLEEVLAKLLAGDLLEAAEALVNELNDGVDYYI